MKTQGLELAMHGLVGMKGF